MKTEQTTTTKTIWRHKLLISGLCQAVCVTHTVVANASLKFIKKAIFKQKNSRNSSIFEVKSNKDYDVMQVDDLCSTVKRSPPITTLVIYLPHYVVQTVSNKIVVYAGKNYSEANPDGSS